MSKEKILIIDDDQMVGSILGEFLEAEGYEVNSVSDGEKGIEALNKEIFDIVFTDLKMPKVDGLMVLEELKKIQPDTIGVLFTGFGTIESAVKAMKLGAFDYITKPINFEELKITLDKAIEYRRLRRENIFLRQQLKAKYRFENLIGDSEPMQAVFRLIEKIARTDSTVLIIGESGTGKELVARAIHFNSERHDRPLVPVNCGAIPEDLLESELFGHEKGAFTGALRTRIGRFEMANGGTIFLDEVGDMSPALQTKILRVLQEQEFERIGGLKTIKVNVRVLAATHRDLEMEIKNGRFREDLYYRLNVIPVNLPPLRDRRSDIPILIDHFLKRFNKEKKQSIEGISEEASKILINYNWPGNVRELENMNERLIILKGKGLIDVQDLPDKVKEFSPDDIFRNITLPDAGLDFNTAISQFEKEIILQALNKTNWVKNKAAKLLHMNRTTLVEKMKKKNILKEAS